MASIGIFGSQNPAFVASAPRVLHSSLMTCFRWRDSRQCLLACCNHHQPLPASLRNCSLCSQNWVPSIIALYLRLAVTRRQQVRSPLKPLSCGSSPFNLNTFRQLRKACRHPNMQAQEVQHGLRRRAGRTGGLEPEYGTFKTCALDSSEGQLAAEQSAVEHCIPALLHKLHGLHRAAAEGKC